MDTGLREWVHRKIEQAIGEINDNVTEMCIREAGNATNEAEYVSRLRELGLDSPAIAHSLYNRIRHSQKSEQSLKRIRTEKNWEQKQIDRAGSFDKKVEAMSDESSEEDDSGVFNEPEFDINTERYGVSLDQGEGEPEVVEAEDELPVVAHRKEIIELIKQHQVVIVSGETGSGKTTKLPQFLVEEGIVTESHQVAVTQPRRLAAMSVAARVAKEMNSKLGDKVGYTIRFKDLTSRSTVVRFMTEGMLVREFMNDPKLTRYSAMVIDEAHERTIYTDILLALAKSLCQQRKDFRVVISSATLNSAKFSRYFDNAHVYNVPGRRFPVDIYYTKQPEPTYIDAALMTVIQIHSSQPLPGDILVFLPGQEEIEKLEDLLTDSIVQMGTAVAELIICPAYSSLPVELQNRIFEPTPQGCRKVVLATNIAETSLTIDGIVYVVDPSLVKNKIYSSRTNMDTFLVEECSKASANQRAGRAGRTAPGKCFRLYTKTSFEQDLPAETTPEILRSNLAAVVLLLVSIGVKNVLQFDFIDKPPVESLVKALELLYSLQAVNHKCELTTIGRCMAEIPADPMTSRALLASIEYGCIDDISTILAMSGEAGPLFYRPRKRRTEADKVHLSLSDDRGDHFTFLNIWKRWSSAQFSQRWCREHFVQIKSLRRARDVREQFIKVCGRLRSRLDTIKNVTHKVEMALIVGFANNIARLSRSGQNFVTLKLNQLVEIHPSSVFRLLHRNPKFILYTELVLTSKEYMRGCTEVEPEWIEEAVPHFRKSF